MKITKIIAGLLFSISAFSADFTIQVNPAANSIDDSKVSSLSISKITNLQSSLDAKASQSAVDSALALKADSSSVSSSLALKADASSLGSLASKSTITNSEVANGALSSSKIANFASDVISSLTSTLANYVLKSDIKTPKMITLSSGSGTYTPTAGTLYIKVRMIGGGGGGAGGGRSSSLGIGGDGGSTSLGSMIAYGGSGGREGDSAPGGLFTCGTVTYCKAFQGGWGGGFGYKQPDGGAMGGGGQGASSPFGGEGGGQSDRNGLSAVPNTGSGGGGGDSFGGCPSNCRSGGGGSAGGYIEAMILNPSAMNYSVGAFGGGGSAGLDGGSGGNGGSGVILIEEFFQ